MVYTVLSSYKLKPTYNIWVWHNADLWLLSVTIDWWESYVTLADKDLWANQVSWQWSWFQWWNYKAFDPQNPWEKIVGEIDPAGYWPSNPLYVDNIKRDPYIKSATNTNLWWWDETDIALKKWPCEEWFHIPTWAEMTTIYNVFKDMTVDLFKEVFKVYPSYRVWWCAMTTPFNDAFVWRCSDSTVEDWDLYWSWVYWDIYKQPKDYFNPTFYRKMNCLVWYIRPFKNEPVAPLWDWWTLIYKYNNNDT